MKFGAIALFSASLSLGLMATPPLASAQDAQGNNTPGEWVVDHFERFGIWASSCDSLGTDDTVQKRCYLRYVDVYSPRPEFAASFLFVFQKDRKTAFQYSNEPGSVFIDNGLGVSRAGSRTYSLPASCQSDGGCIIDDAAAIHQLLAEFETGETFVQTFTDKFGKARQLKWSLDGFQEAVADYKAQSAKRNLLD